MKIVYLSDLHQEFNGPLKGRLPSGDVLVLAGDITVAWNLKPEANNEENKLVKQAFRELVERGDKYSKVYFVIGNHEHYHGVFPHTKQTIQNFLDREFSNHNIVILDNSWDKFNDVLFVGGTLWTDFNKGNYNEMIAIQNWLNDYNLIAQRTWESLTYEQRNSPIDSFRINPEYIYREHSETVLFLEQLLGLHKTNQTVVITHHAPSWKSRPAHRYNSQLGAAFYSDLEWLIEKNPQIALWVHGHSHDNVDYQIFETRIATNQMGYPGENKDFKPNKWIKI